MRFPMLPSSPQFRMTALALTCIAPIYQSYGQNPRSQGSPAVSGSRLGRIEGDLYLVTKSGDVKRGAANEVALFKFRFVKGDEFRRFCAEQKARILEAHPGFAIDSFEVLLGTGKAVAAKAMLDAAGVSLAKSMTVRQQAIEEEAAFLQTLADQTAPTGINGHYVFERVPPGKYFLFATMSLGDQYYHLQEIVQVNAGAKASKDLDNSVSYRAAGYCWTSLQFWE